MSQNTIMFPADYASVAEEEMVYLDGGAQAIPTISDVASGIVSSIAVFCDVMWDSLKSCARSFVEITVDDLRNPNFQAAAALTSLMAIISFAF